VAAEPAAWRAYLRARLVSSTRQLLPPALAMLVFDFERASCEA
jgi:hypothetical protein